MQRKTMIRRALLVSGLAASLAAGLSAAGAANAAEPVKTYWYDGAVRRELWIDPQSRTIVPGPGASAAPQAVTRAASSAPSAPAGVDKRPSGSAGTIANPAAGTTPSVAAPDTSAPRIVQRKGGPAGSSASAATVTDLDTALPGGIVVTLRQPMPDAQARAFLQAQGLTPRSEIGSGSGVWLIDSPAGLETLERANRLYESGVFAGAQPNWYRPLVTK